MIVFKTTVHVDNIQKHILSYINDRAGDYRAFTTGTQVMEGTIVVYIKTVNKMIPKFWKFCGDFNT